MCDFPLMHAFPLTLKLIFYYLRIISELHYFNILGWGEAAEYRSSVFLPFDKLNWSLTQRLLSTLLNAPLGSILHYKIIIASVLII